MIVARPADVPRPVPIVPPGGWPVIGHLPALLGDPLKKLDDWHVAHGDVYRVKLPGTMTWVVNRPEEIERIFTAKGVFRKDRDLRRAKTLFGEGLLTSEGDFWLRQRRLAQPAFHKSRVTAYGERMVSLTQSFAERWQHGETRDVHRDMMSLTLRIATETLFGDVEVSPEIVGRGLDVALTRFEGLNPLLPPWLPVGFPARYRAAVGQLDEVVYAVIARRRSEPAPGTDLLSMFLNAQDEDGARMNDQQLRDEVLTLLLAGHETTANALAWTWQLLTENAQVARALHDELDALSGPPTPADVPRLSYTNAVVQEAMRLYPPAWIMGREVLSDFEIAGHVVPAGAEVAVSQWVVHRDARFFAQPLQFRPERWLDGSTNGLPAYAYFPFGGGQRLCIGKGFALMEAALVLGTLAQRFQLSSTGAPVVPRASLTLRPKGGLPMRVERR